MPCWIARRVTMGAGWRLEGDTYADQETAALFLPRVNGVPWPSRIIEAETFEQATRELQRMMRDGELPE